MEYNFQGLTTFQVDASRSTHGTNQLTPPESESFFDKLQDNFKDPMIIILMVALGLVTILAIAGFAEWYEGVGIAAAVVLATLVSTISEYNNEQTFQKLQAEAARIQVTVFRDGEIVIVNIDDVVVGDRVLLQAGDKIPADGVLVQGQLHVNQAVFTGEARPVSKRPGAAQADGVVREDPHLLYRGTVVDDGEGVLEVQRVGDQTSFGRLAADLQTEDREGPLRVKLKQLALDISRFGYLGASLIAAAFIFKVVFMDNGFDGTQILIYLSDWRQVLYDGATAIILAVIIIVVAVPEGLPMMIAIVLAQNMRKLLNAAVLVRQLLGVETAGSLNVLFCDKTGTITKGQLEVAGWAAIHRVAGQAKIEEISDFDAIPFQARLLLDLALRESSACVVNPNAGHTGTCLAGGNATDRTLMAFIHADQRQALYDRQAASEGEVPRGLLAGLGDRPLQLLTHVPFNTSRKYSACTVAWQSDRGLTLVKGAPEKLLQQTRHTCDADGVRHPFTAEEQALLQAWIDRRTAEGNRIIAVAASTEPLEDDNRLPAELDLVGLLFIRDDARPEAREALQSLQGAGINVVMLTGDSAGTARAIARRVGLIDGRPDDLVLDNIDISPSNQASGTRIAPEELIRALKHQKLKIVSRCRPEDKKMLIKSAQEAGLVVGMTGDGVNDAPALRNADVGFGLGSGTEVAKEAAEIVILDDNIQSITRAVYYGRTIYRNIQRFITFQLTVNISAILVAFLGPFLGFRLPLTMIQLLWVNLIMDTLAALAFSGEPPLPQYMREAPKARTEKLITREMWSSILVNGGFIAALSVFFLTSGWIQGLFRNEAAFLTGFFAMFVFINNWNKFNVRVDGVNLLHHIWQNPLFIKVVGLIFIIQIALTWLGGDVFRTIPLNGLEWTVVTLLSLTIIPLDLLRKHFFNRKTNPFT